MDASGTLRGWAIFVGTAILCLIVLAAAILDPNPSHKQEPEPAVITIGDPQVYARETLINDRRQEIDYLNALIKESETRDFAPQIVRDLRTLEQVRAVLKVSAAAPPPEQSDEITSSSTQQLDAVTTTPTAPEKPDVEPEKDKPPDPKHTHGISPLDEFRDRQVYRAELRAALAAVNLDDLHDFGGNALYRLQFNATILPGAERDKFGVAHLIVQRPRVGKSDIETLFYTWINHAGQRLNPGYVAKAGTWSNNRAMREFYIAVGTATRIYDLLDLCYADCRDENKRQSILLPVPPETSDDFRSAFGVGPYGELSAEPTIRTAETYDPTADRHTEAAQLASRYLVPLGSDRTWTIRMLAGCRVRTDNHVGFTKEEQEAVPTVLTRLRAIRMADASLLGLERYSLSSGKLTALPRKLSRVRRIAERVRRRLLDAAENRIDCARELERRYESLPESFLVAILDDHKCFRFLHGDDERVRSFHPDKTAKPNRCLLTGSAYAYGTTPVELGQRMSTSVSLAQSLELALAASASLANRGSLGHNLDLVSATAGRIDSAERLPLTIGYSTRDVIHLLAPINDPKNPFPDLTPSFGWVFGPTLRFEGSGGQVKMMQIPRSEGLTADLSVPTWWPFLKLKVQTAWVADWREGSNPPHEAKHDKQPYIEVRFPKKAADLDMVTQRLLASDVATSTAGRQPFIERVRPNDISLCADNVTFVIQGTNVWRGTEVFLGGVKAKSISVLPDMEGIAATFDMSQAFTPKSAAAGPRAFDPTHQNWRRSTDEERDAQNARGDKDKRVGPNARRVVLTVATRNGSTEAPIRITAATGKKNCADASLLNAPGGN